MILVRASTDMNEPSRLLPASADRFDDTTEMVYLTEPVDVDGQLTIMVPPSICYDFDASAMDAINSLVTSAKDKLNAARQMMTAELVNAQFNFETAKTDDIRRH